ncbi:MAG: molybdopterin molybdotransferase MoeA [Planctomycetota bacterium]|nr:molybdopterin molybdotransferase MoeA [Planctomycetota bacterium]MDA1214323.1 molybdopterin molybdotransferase MoeA [Planctomycetota bacterium]
MTSPNRSPFEVRMKGFASRTLVADAVRWVDDQISSLGEERLAVASAFGRILSHDIVSPMDVPGFDRSAMDGYALRGEETDGASPYNPLSLRIIGESLPGREFGDELIPGSAVRIMTGAPVPRGADAVLPAEFAEEQDDTLICQAAVPTGKNISCRGEDVVAGSTVWKTGRSLRPQDLGLMSSLGIAEVNVRRQPRVRIFITGSELVTPGQPLGPHQIYEANSSMLAALVHRDRGIVESIHFVGDDKEQLRNSLTTNGADVVLISGGSSVGKEDFAPSILAEEGELPIHGVAMRPSSPTGIGRIKQSLVFLLPGNPVSCLCAYDFFAGRAIRQLGGRSADWPYRTAQHQLTRKIASAIGRVDYCRVKLDKVGVEPLSISGAAILSSTTRADGFVVVPHDLEGYPVGATVMVYLYDAAGNES